ncbi:hypothetical protein Y032_0008g212 [Ancylostoma ceylanicum]|uniref:Uncharacterized protein n=1 Tax=Ancylostoma ceylanicum TaxID=53326 RepID=A0A016VLD2_9BILA|nr:hypothetical protein Y032_0008g212 [Ancylostoma ceylanicum]
MRFTEEVTIYGVRRHSKFYPITSNFPAPAIVNSNRSWTRGKTAAMVVWLSAAPLEAAGNHDVSDVFHRYDRLEFTVCESLPLRGANDAKMVD